MPLTLEELKSYAPNEIITYYTNNPLDLFYSTAGHYFAPPLTSDFLPSSVRETLIEIAINYLKHNPNVINEYGYQILRAGSKLYYAAGNTKLLDVIKEKVSLPKETIQELLREFGTIKDSSATVKIPNKMHVTKYIIDMAISSGFNDFLSILEYALTDDIYNKQIKEAILKQLSEEPTHPLYNEKDMYSSLYAALSTNYEILLMLLNTKNLDFNNHLVNEAIKNLLLRFEYISSISQECVKLLIEAGAHVDTTCFRDESVEYNNKPHHKYFNAALLSDAIIAGDVKKISELTKNADLELTKLRLHKHFAKTKLDPELIFGALINFKTNKILSEENLRLLKDDIIMPNTRAELSLLVATNLESQGLLDAATFDSIYDAHRNPKKHKDKQAIPNLQPSGHSKSLDDEDEKKAVAPKTDFISSVLQNPKMQKASKVLELLNNNKHVLTFKELESLYQINKQALVTFQAVIENNQEFISNLPCDFNFNIQDRNGNTPLILAAQNHNDAIAELLLKAGADPRIGNKKGENALFVAGFDLREKMEEYLSEKKPDSMAANAQLTITQIPKL